MDFELSNVGVAFTLTLIAGLSTGIGSAIAFFAKRTNTNFLAISLGFSAGVMVYVSLVEILQEGMAALSRDCGSTAGHWYAILSFFGGILVIMIIDKLVPSFENPHEIRSVESMQEAPQIHNKGLARMGLMSALAIGIHNFPEGIATFTAGLGSPEIAIPLTVAIAIHNIPEGIAVSVPIYYATGNKKKAFILSFLSGLSEPVGAIIAFVMIYFFTGLSESVIGILFSSVAGIMVFISLDELLPAAEKYGKHHQAIMGLVAGMLVMAVSLALFN
ncbi:zinc transporter ZupT [Marinilabiliaceae bacterium JC040]|nr:zinc transporter ZupT [Marinilabiliaceae bacterium JC040]